MPLKAFPVKRQRKRRLYGPTVSPSINRAIKASMDKRSQQFRDHMRSHMLPVRYQP